MCISMKKRILTEAAGSPVSTYMIKAIQQSGHIAVASDITVNCAAEVLRMILLFFQRKMTQIYGTKLSNVWLRAK